MSRLSLRSAFAALAFALAAFGAATLGAGEAGAKPFKGGGFGFRHHHHVHGGMRLWGPTYVRLAAYPFAGGCVVRRFVAFDGSLVIRRRCY